MQTTIIILLSVAMIITSIVNFAKPAYQEFVWKYEPTINILLSFILWVCSAFAIRPYLEWDLSTWAIILLWLALGTWANIFYDIWSLIQWFGSKLRDRPIETVEEKPASIGYDLPIDEETDDEQD